MPLADPKTRRSYKCIAHFILLPVSLALTACGGSGVGLDENGRPWSEHDWSTSGESSDTDGNTQFNRIQSTILTPQCATSGCHAGTASPLGLDLSASVAYDNLLTMSSSQVSGLQLVEPSNADASYLVHKIQGTQSAGQQMPLYRPPLSDEQLTLVRQWISDGAPPPSDTTDTSTGDTTGTDGDQDTTPIPQLSESFASIQAVVFDTECAGCHSGDTPAGNLSLVEGTSYAQLTGRAATLDPQGMPLVDPGNAAGSFLIDKLRDTDLGTPETATYRGERMPLMGAPLDESVIDTIARWIDAGALDN